MSQMEIWRSPQITGQDSMPNYGNFSSGTNSSEPGLPLDLTSLPISIVHMLARQDTGFDQHQDLKDPPLLYQKILDILKSHWHLLSFCIEDLITWQRQRWQQQQLQQQTLFSNRWQKASPTNPLVDVPLLRDLKKLLTSDEDSDVTIKVKSREFRAHKNILRARSPVFFKMFSHDMVEKQNGVIEINDCEPEDFRLFLHCLYSGELDTVSMDILFNVYYFGHMFEVESVKKTCAIFVLRYLYVDTFCEIVRFALLFEELTILEAVSEFFVLNFQEIVSANQWSSFVMDHPATVGQLFSAIDDDQIKKNLQNSNPLLNEHFNKYLIHSCQCRDTNHRISESQIKNSIIQWPEQEADGFCSICKKFTSLYCCQRKPCEETHQNSQFPLDPQILRYLPRIIEGNMFIDTKFKTATTSSNHGSLQNGTLSPTTAWIRMLRILEYPNSSQQRKGVLDILKSNSHLLTCCIKHLTYGQPLQCQKQQWQKEQQQLLLNLPTLQRDLKNLLTSGEDSDVTIKVKGHEFRAHKNVLRVRSPVFFKMLSHDTLEGKNRVIDDNDYEPEAFQEFLFCLYSGKLDNVSMETVFDVYYIGKKYAVKDIKETCVISVLKSLSVDTYSEIAKFAMRSKESAILEAVSEYFKKHFEEILAKDPWPSFYTDDPDAADELLAKFWDRKSRKNRNSDDGINEFKPHHYETSIRKVFPKRFNDGMKTGIKSSHKLLKNFR